MKNSNDVKEETGITIISGWGIALAF